MKHALLLFGFLSIVLFPMKLAAETIYLKTGESISGTIIRTEPNFLYVESNAGYGTLKIPIEHIIVVTYSDMTKDDLSQRYGVGYVDKNLARGTDGMQYKTNQISFRTYFKRSFFLDYLLGYTGYQFKPNKNSATQKFSVFQGDIRGAYVFSGRQNAMVYAGISLGVFSVEDSKNDFKESGAEGSVFLGTELFFQTMPDFGFSGEISIHHQNSSRFQRNDIGVLSLPTLSVHYYF